MVRAWNTCAAALQGWSLQPLTEPPLNDIPYFIFKLQEIVSQLVRLVVTIVVLIKNYRNR